MHRLHRPLHRRRVDRQRRRRSDARRERRERRRTHLAGACAPSPCGLAVAATGCAFRCRARTRGVRRRSRDAAGGVVHRGHAIAQERRFAAGSSAELRDHEPARRQPVRHRSRHAARRAADHLRRRERHMGARRQARRHRALGTLGAVAGAPRAHAAGTGWESGRDRALRSARRGSENGEGFWLGTPAAPQRRLDFVIRRKTG